jgi:8-amino-7-oxononanoate synthase
VSTGSPLQARVTARLSALDEHCLIRRLRAPSGFDLSSNDYLGLARHPRIVQAMADAAAREGCGSTGSRLLRGHRDVFDAVENAFAAFKGTERALYFSSGYLANLAVLTTFAEAGDVVLSDQLNHASLRDGLRLSAARRIVFSHNDAQALTDHLVAAHGDGQTFVVVESLFSMDGDRAPLAEYAAICRDHGAMLIVDEAHAVGLYGRHGSGLIEELGAGDGVCLSVNSGGKALGVAGAFVAGPAWAIEYLVQRARPFVFSTAPPPAIAAALEAAIEVVADEPERRTTVRRRAAALRAALIASGAAVEQDDSPVIPIVLGGAERAMAVAGTLQARGFDVRAIRPPTVPEGTARLRISVNVGLTDALMDEFVAALMAALHAADVWPAVSS